MNRINLVRLESSTHGTFGLFMLPGGKTVVSLELPWHDNKPNVSRIPTGEYLAKWHKSPKFGWCYWLQDVPGRSGILIHPGNYAGDRGEGLKTHSYGCILTGKRKGRLGNQLAAYSSRPALDTLIDAVGENDFILNIMEPGVWNG